MLSTLKRWFGHDGDVAASAPSLAEATRTDAALHRPELIPRLQDEHRRLLALFAELEDASEHEDDSACRSALDAFTRVLQEHLLTENRHLYDWLARNPAADADVAHQVDNMSQDMMRIGHMLHRFITTYARAAWTPLLHAQLRKDLRPIGEVLAHRIHEEESVLYPLYSSRPD